MDYRNFKFTNPDYIILVSRETSIPTESGKGWSKRNRSIERKVYTPVNYTNHITAVPFFNSFGHGAYSRCAFDYTPAGYLPVKETCVSPFKECRKITTFTFINRKRAYNSGGYRERAVLDNLETWEPFECNNRRVYTFIARDGSAAAYEPGYNRWIG